MITALDHATVLVRELDRSLAFYVGVLGLQVGARPAFDFPGAWLYAGRRAVLHLVGGRAVPPAGVIDHAAFAATDLRRTVAALRAAGVPFRLLRLPDEGAWQLFCHDPDGARIELDFDAAEPGPEPAAEGP